MIFTVFSVFEGVNNGIVDVIHQNPRYYAGFGLSVVEMRGIEPLTS